MSITVQQAVDRRLEMTGAERQLHDVIECCLNAEAAFGFLGCKRPKSTRGFLPAGVQTLVQIQDVLATMPDEVALVKASMAFACELCGKPAETGNEDCWVCEACIAEGDPNA